jgi:hypothetical protein
MPRDSLAGRSNLQKDLSISDSNKMQCLKIFMQVNGGHLTWTVAMPVTLGNFKTQFARGRLSLVKRIKSFHQKQSRESKIGADYVPIILSPRGRTDPVRVKIPEVALKRGENSIAKPKTRESPDYPFNDCADLIRT